MKMDTFYESFETECENSPVLRYYDAKLMLQRVICASNEDIVKIKEMLMERARKNTKALSDELGFFINLKNVMVIYCKGKKVSVKNVMIQEFSDSLNYIIELYATAQGKIVYR